MLFVPALIFTLKTLRICGAQSLPNLGKEHTLMTSNAKSANTPYTESIMGVPLELRLSNGDGLYLRQNASIVVGSVCIREWIDTRIELEITSLRTAPFIMPLDLEESFSIELTIALP